MARPFIHINCASSLDGKIARPDGSRLRISGPWDMERVHRLRSDLGAILVGAGTIISDDPKLTIKEEYVPGAPPLEKIIIDGLGKVPLSSRSLRTEGRSIIITSHECDRQWHRSLKSVREEEGLDLEIVQLGSRGGKLDLEEAMEALYDLEVTGILVEGGSRTIWEFVELGLFDKFTIYYGPMLIGGSGPSIIGGMGFMESPTSIKIEKIKRTPDGGILVEMSPNDQ